MKLELDRDKYIYAVFSKPRVSSLPNRTQKTTLRLSRKTRSVMLGGVGPRALDASGIEKSFCNIVMNVIGATPINVVAKTNISRIDFKFKRNGTTYSTNTRGSYNAVFTGATPLVGTHQHILRVSNIPMPGHEFLLHIINLKTEYLYQQKAANTATRKFVILKLADDTLGGYTFEKIDTHVDSGLACQVFSIGIFMRDDIDSTGDLLNRNYHIYSVLPKHSGGDLKTMVKVLSNPATTDIAEKNKYMRVVQIALAKANQIDMFMMCDTKCGNVIVNDNSTDAFIIDFDDQFIIHKDSTNHDDTPCFPDGKILGIPINKKMFGYYNETILLCDIVKNVSDLHTNKGYTYDIFDNILYKYATIRLKFLLIDTPQFGNIFKEMIKTIKLVRDNQTFYGHDLVVEFITKYASKLGAFPGEVSPGRLSSPKKTQKESSYKVFDP